MRVRGHPSADVHAPESRELIGTLSQVATFVPSNSHRKNTYPEEGAPVLCEGSEIGKLRFNAEIGPEALSRAVASLLGLSLGNLVTLQRTRELNHGLQLDRVYFEELFEASPEAIAVLDQEDRVVRVNREFERLFGYRESDAQGRTINELIVPPDLQTDAMTLTREVTGGKQVRAERLRQRKDGSQIFVSILGSPVKMQGDQVGIYGIYRDITAQKEAEEHLRRLTTTDDLTGLLNRRGFFLLAEHQRRLALRENAELLLLYIDIDDFKAINDTYGHLEGDQVLADLGRILQSSYRDSDILARMIDQGVLARMGGDEFVILAIDAGDSGEKILTERLRARIDQYNRERNRPYRVSLSVGAMRVVPDRHLTLDSILAAADRLMYQDKRGRIRL